MSRSKVQAFIFTGIVAFSALCAMGLNEILPDITIPEISFKKYTGNDGKGGGVSTKKSNRKSKNYKEANKQGKVIDNYKGVAVYYNGSVSNVKGRNVTKDGYNLGLRYQCVEFIKRFYYEHYDHKMPDSYGHAKDFINFSIPDGNFNEKRGLYQFRNGSIARPKETDIIVFGPTSFNSFGHIAIISKVTSNSIEIVQQNPGARNPSRMNYSLHKTEGGWYIENSFVRGWLSKSLH